MNYLAIICGLLLMFGICIAGPLVAMAEIRKESINLNQWGGAEVHSSSPASCGFRCVIQTRAWRTWDRTNAENFCSATAGTLYESNGWVFVDYNITEEEASRSEGGD